MALNGATGRSAPRTAASRTEADQATAPGAGQPRWDGIALLRLLALILSVLTAVGLVLLLGWAALLICPALALATLVFSSGAADPSDLQEAPALHWHMTAPAGFR